MQARETYHVSNYSPEDLTAYLQFCLDMQLISPVPGVPSVQLVEEKLRRPHYEPERDLFVARAGEEIIGHVDITAEPPIDRAILECLVHPQHRRKGIGTRLLDSALARLEQLGISHAQFNLLEDNTGGQEFLTQRGFSHIRGFLELRAPMDRVDWQRPAVPSGLTYRPLHKGEEATLAHLQNKCFTGSWGFNPNTEEDIVYLTTLTGNSVEDIRIAEFKGEIIAYCWVTRPGEGPVGRVHMIGVDPKYRGLRLGKRVLLDGLERLKEQGVEELEVTVDSQNPGAYRLYQDVGFGVWKISLWYQKRVGESTENSASTC